MTNISGLGQFIDQFPKSVFQRNSLIASAEDIKSYIYFLESGLVKQYCVSPAGSVFMTHLFHSGAFFPPTIISGADLDGCYFEAFTPVIVRIIPLEAFTGLMRSHPDILMEFVTRLSHQFAALSHRINLLAGSTAYQRTAAAVIYLGERLGNPVEGNGQILIDQVITHKELAAWSGTARETASLNMKTLERKGLITYHKHRIMITSLDKLLRESGQ